MNMHLGVKLLLVRIWEEKIYFAVLNPNPCRLVRIWIRQTDADPTGFRSATLLDRYVGGYNIALLTIVQFYFFDTLLTDKIVAGFQLFHADQYSYRNPFLAKTLSAKNGGSWNYVNCKLWVSSIFFS